MVPSQRWRFVPVRAQCAVPLRFQQSLTRLRPVRTRAGPSYTPSNYGEGGLRMNAPPRRARWFAVGLAWAVGALPPTLHAAARAAAPPSPFPPAAPLSTLGPMRV